MPIDLHLVDNVEQAIARYKHYDVMMVNAMFDGMNLVAKEGPLVNERAGVSILGENTGAHEELGEFALRSEEHTSELQSRQYLVCRLLLEKKKKHSNKEQ